jgi:CMP-N,N'-diacetyllegionaminic acid synthase
MFNGQKILAIIPARGGSKGLPGKNIRSLAGKPLIAWSIEAATASSYIDKTIISSDCPDICRLAKQFGADVPFLRPAELATDEAKGIDATLHAIDWLKKNGESYQLIIILQPTSPLRTTEDIERSIERYANSTAKAIVSVCKVEHHPWWSNTLPEDGNMGQFLRPEALNSNRQELPNYYRLNGAIYLSEVDYLRKHRSCLGPETLAYEMPTEQSVDIDSLIDFKLAEILISERNS